MLVPTGEDFHLSLDSTGVFVYFALRGHRFLLNGNTGFFRALLADFAVEALDAMLLPDAEREAAWASVRDRYGRDGRELVEQLVQVRKGTHDCLAAERRMECFRTRGAPATFTVYLAQACNQRCRYCYSQGGTFGRKAAVMSCETAKEVLAFLLRQARALPDRELSVMLFGGEPLMALDALRLLVRGVHAYNRENPGHVIHLVLTTNGSLWDDEVFRVFAADPKSYLIGVSLDADRATHDGNRPFVAEGRGSPFDGALATICRLRELGCRVSATCVVSRPYDFIGAAKSLRALGLHSFELKQPIFHVYGQEQLPSVLTRDFDAWREGYLRYCDYYLDHVTELSAACFIDRVATVCETTRLLHRDDGTTLACGAAEKKVSVAVDGTLMACESFMGAPESALGDVRDGFDPQKCEAFEGWLLSAGQHRVDVPRCRDCFAKRFCGGGCYAASVDRTGRIEPLDDADCRYVREQLKIDLYFTSQLRQRHPAQWASCLWGET
jgi:uncharacterized protein